MLEEYNYFRKICLFALYFHLHSNCSSIIMSELLFQNFFHKKTQHSSFHNLEVVMLEILIQGVDLIEIHEHIYIHIRMKNAFLVNLHSLHLIQSAKQYNQARFHTTFLSSE